MSNLTVKSSAVPQAQQQDEFGNLPVSQATSLASQFIRCDVGQPLSKKLEKGKFNFKGIDWQPVESLTDVVFLKAQMNRVLFGATFDSPAMCRSDNFHQPSPSIAAPVCDSCGACPLGKWDNQLDDNAKGVKRRYEQLLGKKKSSPAPLCNETINVIVADKRLIPFVLKFQKTQLKIVTDQLINKLRFNNKGKRAWETMFDVTLVDKDSYYEYRFENFRDNPDSELYKELYETVSVIAEQALAAQHAQMDQEKVAEPVEAKTPSFDADEEIPF